jgi:hypothetical protein
MPDTATELVQRIHDARGELRDAILAMSGRWDEECLPSEAPQVDPGAEDGTWTPREAAEHVVLGQAFHLMILARSLHADRFATAADAVGVLDALGAAVDLVTAHVHDEDLRRFASGIGEGQQNYLRQLGFEPDRDLRAVLRISAGHLADHAQQLRKAASDG